jgi:hypothetical protein
MNDFDKILWGFIFSVCGVIFGWTLNQLGQWFRTRAEDKKNVKVVLFNLLQTYHLFYSSDIDSYINKIIKTMSNKIPHEERGEFNQFMNQILPTIIKELFKPEQKEEVISVKTNYTNSIQILSSIDPLTAYYISGNANVLEIFDSIEKSFSYFEKEFPIDKNELNEFCNKMLGEIRPNLMNKALEELEKDITSIAWKINPIVWFKSKKAIKYFKEESTKSIDAEIENIVIQIMKLVDEKERTTTANSCYPL